MFNLIVGTNGTNPGQTAQLKAWTRECFQLPEETTILVSELRCQEEDCPDIETFIAILTGPGSSIKHKILKPLSEVTREDVLRLASESKAR